MNVSGWQKRLEITFSSHGVIGEELLEIIELEKACYAYFIDKYKGQNIIIDSFLSFYIDTLKRVFSWLSKNGWPKQSENYQLVLLYFMMIFRSFRACENLLLAGYPLDGYSLLRDLKDRAIFLAGIAHNITTMPRLLGYDKVESVTAENWKKLKEARKKEERRVLDRMIRKDSGLPPEHIATLFQWEQLFHEEVHGARLSFFSEMGEWIKSGRGPSIGPKPIDSNMAMYMNRVSEIAWMMVLLLPYLQPDKNAFGDSWHEKKNILDDSFRFMEIELGNIGKDIGKTFVNFMDNKFKFDSTFYYIEATGSLGT